MSPFSKIASTREARPPIVKKIQQTSSSLKFSAQHPSVMHHYLFRPFMTRHRSCLLFSNWSRPQEWLGRIVESKSLELAPVPVRQDTSAAICAYGSWNKSFPVDPAKAQNTAHLARIGDKIEYMRTFKLQGSYDNHKSLASLGEKQKT